MGNHPEAWENKDVNFGVAEESEQVLIQDWVSPSGRIEKGGVKVSVG